MEANNREEDGRLIPELAQFNQPLDKITPDALRKFIQPFGITNINPEDPNNLPIVLELLRLDEKYANRLKAVLQGGVPHQVLNARKHTEESQIIAGAGAFGAVTIATNMAGRGVDIKLGGELAEEVIAAVNRVLRKAGHRDPFDMTLEERRAALQKTDPSLFGIYEAEVKLFLQYFEDMEKVKELGGLHVIGSERHEARRIDNQLRGRAARQGDPGSSRFYLSLQDDLMRLFGGEQVSNLMERLKVDDSLPLEVRLVSNIIESSQTRVEGANFDVRKHLLEYDDVLNKQRAQIYSQRDRIFVKEDLHDDVTEMIRAEVRKRVELGLADEEGPWKLIAWLDQVQPPFATEDRLFPTFGLSLLLERISSDDLRLSILNVVTNAVEAESAHTLRAIEALIERTGENLKTQISEREDALDAYFQTLRDMDETPRPQKMLEEINGLVRLQLRLNNEMMRALGDDPEDIKEDIQDILARQLTALAAARLIGAIQNRLGEPLPLPSPLPADWDELEGIILNAAQEALAAKKERLVGENGQIPRDIEALMPGDPSTGSGRGINETAILRLLMSLSQGARTVFDQKTHRQVKQVYSRFSYVFYEAQLLEGREADDLVEEVIEHLEEAEAALQHAIGQGEFNRLSQNAARLADFGPAARVVFGEDRLNEPAAGIGSEKDALIEAIGKYVLNENYRRLLLGAFTELWVDYLTRVEALRVSIGLEAYAQRDPLVQYKSKASEMFQQLMEDVRGLVISRVFAYQPRRVEIAPIEAADAPAPAAQQTLQVSGGQKKRRRRH
jgi:preprotein translocase subunit SecA